ncbi:MAG: lipoyl(octanoyl) transferase [Phycisphaeraceae bacterium]|nr:MAG: lipoyl(octanoyl) transferase [Phycisphaeraceae bacterium]
MIEPASDSKAGARRHALVVEDLGRIDYALGYETQLERVEAVLGARAAAEAGDVAAPRAVGHLLLLEHDPPVITISRRPNARAHLTATDAQLRAAGVEVAETDRGGDITYHGPGQLVVYPILDLSLLGLGLHDYMRLLERIVIAVCESFGLRAHRDICATGVWVGGEQASSTMQQGGAARDADAACAGPAGGSKICAMGVRVRRWVSMHGLALNVRTNLDHFNLIVPCGLAGRTVTSLERELGASCPTMQQVKATLTDRFNSEIAAIFNDR